MVDTTEAMESKYLTADMVKASPTKKATILEGGSYEEVTYEGETARRLTILVEVDQKRKIWRPNRDTVSNLQVWGKDSEQWVGKVARLQTMKIQGKDCIIGIPEHSP